MKHGFLIAAPHSGSGKTTIARGLMALFTRKGYNLLSPTTNQPAKKPT